MRMAGDNGWDYGVRLIARLRSCKTAPACHLSRPRHASSAHSHRPHLGSPDESDGRADMYLFLYNSGLFHGDLLILHSTRKFIFSQNTLASPFSIDFLV